MPANIMTGPGVRCRGLAGLHTQCGTDVCLASPSGDRATMAQWRNLECMNKVTDERDFTELGCLISRAEHFDM